MSSSGAKSKECTHPPARKCLGRREKKKKKKKKKREEGMDE